MTIPTISQVISAIASVLHRDTINPTIPATQDDFVNSVEAFFDTISDTTVGELNTLKTEINTTVSAMNTVADEVENNANIAAAVGNYQGEWSNSVTYSKSQGVSVGDLHYISKVNSNLNHAVTDTNYWIPNPINSKANSNDVYTQTQLNLKISTQQFDKPNINTPLFIKVSASSIKIPSGFQITVNGNSFKLSTDYTLTLASNLVGSTKTAGTDYFVYAKQDGSFYISANESITTDRLIGGFHYGLVGESEAVTGNKLEVDMVKIRGINAYSFWDLKYRPVANPKGMVNIGGVWYDIYLLNSEHITNGTSKAGLLIAGGVALNGRGIPKIPLEYGGNNTINYGKFTWFQACEVAKAHNKRLISYAEFPTIAYGVLEGASSSLNGYETVAGEIEHYSNLTSKYGIEQATGVQWVWGSDLANAHGTTDWAWKDNADGRGQIYSTSSSPTVVVLGGDRGNGVNSGSRASDWRYYVWASIWGVGCRFACDHLTLA